MYLIRAVPIAKGIGKDSLTYFSKETLTPGNIINVKVRSKDISALVQSCEAITSEHKSDIKSLPFIVRKVGNNTEQAFFLPEFARAVENISTYHATNQGSVYSALIPQSILDRRDEIKKLKLDSEIINKNLKIEIFQAEDEVRISHYKMIIREGFAKKQNIFILVPTAHEAENLRKTLEKGIEQHTFALHGNLSKKESLFFWNEIINTSHPVLIIATALFLSLPKIWSVIIVERESSRHYKMSSRPYLDMRVVAEIIAKEMKSICILSDTMLRVETLFRYDQGELQELSEPRWRSLTNANVRLVDMQEYNKTKKDFIILSDELKELIESTKRENRHLFIYVSRRGLASQIICKDCGLVVLCKNCSSPLVLHPEYFLCHTCGTKSPASDSCTGCGGWRLESYGIGIDKVVKEISTIIDPEHIFQIDSDITPTRKKILTTIDAFYEKPGAVLVGTDMATHYINNNIENVAIASLDSQFSIPDFRIKEKIFHMVLRLRNIASQELLIQTRYASLSLWDHSTKGNLIDFYREELSLRKKYRYPPECVLIKISYTGTPANVRLEMQNLKEILKNWDLSIFPAFIEIKRGKFTMHATIRLGNNKWPDFDLLNKLKELSMEYTVNVNPENLL